MLNFSTFVYFCFLYNKYNVNNAITAVIEKKYKKEFMISTLACILSVTVIYDYIINLFTVFIYNKINEDSISTIPSPYDFIIIICLFILSISIINYIVYRIESKK